MKFHVNVSRAVQHVDALKELATRLTAEAASVEPEASEKLLIQRDAALTAISFMSGAIAKAATEKIATFDLPDNLKQAEKRRLELLGVLRELWDFNALNPTASDDERAIAKRTLLSVMRENDYLKAYIRRRNIEIAESKQSANAAKEKSVKPTPAKKQQEAKPKRVFSVPANVQSQIKKQAGASK